MRLQRIELQGYKSFADKTEFLFPTGITAIVGPNGSGKSNIADAIRWALGERSMSVLRAKSTADMIFAGGQGRAQAGMAEVSLTFDNEDGTLPIEFSEVTITRRAYRSSENEYLINGSQVLLRDINELLAESGLSERTYTVIGQGLVDTALSLRPEERRTLFEEAAGISLYRDRREKALDRLDETQHNLERVHDIISEVEPRLERLKRDAKQVEEHRRLTAHLERLQRTWYGYKWGRRQAELDRALERASNLESRLESRQHKVSELDEQLSRVREQEGELRAQLRDWYRDSADLHERVDEAQRELAVSEERQRLLKVRREELLEEIEPLDAQREEQAEEVAAIQERVEELEGELEERKARLAKVEQEARRREREVERRERERERLEQELRAHRAKMERLDQELLEAREEVSQLASEQAVAKEQARQFESRRQEILAELDPLDEEEKAQIRRVEQAQAEVERLERELAARRERLAELEQEWEAAQQREQEPDQDRLRVVNKLESSRGRIKRLDRELREAQEREAQLAGELKALERMRAAGAAYGKGVRALLEAEIDGVLEPLAGLIQVPPGWERAVEAALRDDLQAVVVDDLSVVEEARRIVEDAGGRLTLLPLEGLRGAPSLSSGALRAADVAECEKKVRVAVEAMLGRVALCESLSDARALLRDMPPGARCVTAEGIVLRSDGAVVVGEVGDGDLLADERARRELPVQLEGVRRRCEELEAERRAASEQVAELEARLEELDREVAAAWERKSRAYQERLGEARTRIAVAEETLRSQRTELEREEAALERLRSRRSALREQAEGLENKHAAAVERAKALHAAVSAVDAAPEGVSEPVPSEGADVAQEFRSRLEEAHRRCYEIEERQREESKRGATLESRLEELTRRVEEAREKAARVEREKVSEARTRVAVSEESLRSGQAALQREKERLKQLRSQLDARRQRADELKAERSALVTRVGELREKASRLEGELREIRGQIQPAEERLDRLSDRQEALEKRLERARKRTRDMEARHGRAELKVERCRDALRLLAERIEEDLGLVELELAESVTAQTPLPMRPLVSELPVVEELPEGLEEEMTFLEKRLRRLGSINPNAPEELTEVQERYDFLTDQAADLEAASSRLREAVAELDDLMASSFQETFGAVADRFAELFTNLFGGGEARLELTEPDDLLNTGVEIMARPPGKRTQRLALLSGGERALTAVAVLFALLHVSPTPFCVFDEVDAMLDEANVSRFRLELEALARETQSIIITHNRGTVESADTIYGISMGSDAVSQVVSLKMEEVGENQEAGSKKQVAGVS